MKGKLTKQYSVNCGHCGISRIVGDADTDEVAAAHEVERMGWFFSQVRGWLCPSCTWLRHG